MGFLDELKARFASKRPPTHPDREDSRIDRDALRAVAARAEAFATVGPPVDATLDPVTAPENVQLRASKSDQQRPQKRRSMRSKGTSRGLERGKQALVQECGWGEREAERIKQEAEFGEMTEQQFMRIVESELQASTTSGRVMGREVDLGGGRR